jgi:Glycosyl transferase family 2
MKLAPIVIFAYNRPELLSKTIEALKANYLAKESDLFIFSDGYKDEISKEMVESVREIIYGVEGFNSVTIYESKTNLGLARSVIDGVSMIIKEYEKIIVLEDDLITSPNFLNFVNKGLEFYQSNPKVFSISGYSFNLKSLDNYEKDYYLGYRASSLGWGTWLDRWNKIDWEVKSFNITNLLQQYRFIRGGSDLPFMLMKQKFGKIDSWAVRWCFNQSINNLYTIIASKSKVLHVGVGGAATHVRVTHRFDTVLDDGKQVDFKFNTDIQINNELVHEFREVFSVKNRLKEKLKLKLK